MVSTQKALSEAESIRRQDALIREEEEAERLEDQRQAARSAADRERKARKKAHASPLDCPSSSDHHSCLHGTLLGAT